MNTQPSPSPYDILMELHGRCVRMETKLDALHDEQLAKRVSNLETSQKIMAALSAVIAFVVTFFQDAITKTLGI